MFFLKNINVWTKITDNGRSLSKKSSFHAIYIYYCGFICTRATLYWPVSMRSPAKLVHEGPTGLTNSVIVYRCDILHKIVRNTETECLSQWKSDGMHRLLKNRQGIVMDSISFKSMSIKHERFYICIIQLFLNIADVTISVWCFHISICAPMFSYKIWLSEMQCPYSLLVNM